METSVPLHYGMNSVLNHMRHNSKYVVNISIEI